MKRTMRIASTMAVPLLTHSVSAFVGHAPRHHSFGCNVFQQNLLLQQRNAAFCQQQRSDNQVINGVFGPCYMSSSDDERTESTTESGAKNLEAGSHEELMYALGINLARQVGDIRPLVEDGEELSNVARGVLDVIVGRLDESEQANLLLSRKDDINNLLVTRSAKLKKKLEESGREMLEQMKESEGAFVLPSGVVIQPLEPGPDGFGEGVRPTLSSSVKVHYHGTLPDGTVVDSSLTGKDAKPVTFALGQVVTGWRDGLQKMHEGETAMLGIPPEAGYGDQGSPDGRIPGGATLFFKVQLIEVLTAGVGGSPKLLGVDGKAIKKDKVSGSGLLGVDGKPL